MLKVETFFSDYECEFTAKDKLAEYLTRNQITREQIVSLQYAPIFRHDWEELQDRILLIVDVKEGD